LDDFVEQLESQYIDTSNDEKVMVPVARMYESGFFKEKDLTDWEKKPAADQNWAKLKSYFGEIYTNKRRYSQSMAMQTRFMEQMANIEERRDEEEQTKEGEDVAMMFGILQQPHQEQMNVMQEANKTAQELMQMQMKQMAEQQKQATAQMAAFMKLMTAMQQNGAQGQATTTRKGRNDGPIYCKNCKLNGFHQPDSCFELEKNKSKRPKDWVS